MKQRDYKFGIFYYDKDEPKLLIDENLNLSRGIAINGQIVNFAHWKKLVAILGLALLVGVIAFLIFR